MIHYDLLKLKEGADVTSIYFHCRKVYAELALDLPFLHTKVSRCADTKNPSADIMLVVQVDAPEQLGACFAHPKYAALYQAVKDYVAEKMSFDEKAGC